MITASIKNEVHEMYCFGIFLSRKLCKVLKSSQCDDNKMVSNAELTFTDIRTRVRIR